MTIRDASTGDTLHHSGSGRTYDRCDFSLATAYDAVKLNLLHPDIDQWCVESSGEHRAWNDAGDEVEQESRHPAGCESLIGLIDPEGGPRAP